MRYSKVNTIIVTDVLGFVPERTDDGFQYIGNLTLTPLQNFEWHPNSKEEGRLKINPNVCMEKILATNLCADRDVKISAYIKAMPPNDVMIYTTGAISAQFGFSDFTIDMTPEFSLNELETAQAFIERVK